MRFYRSTLLLALGLLAPLGCSSILGISGEPVTRDPGIMDAGEGEDSESDAGPTEEASTADSTTTEAGPSCDFPDAGGPFATDMPTVVISSPSSFEDDGRWRSTTTATEDTRTGLKWQLKTVDGNGQPVLVTFSQAEEICRTLSIGGLTGWRIPTKFELFTVVQYNAFKPDFLAPNDVPTNGISPAGITEMADTSVGQGYWSSSKTPTGQIWTVSHGPGESRPDPQFPTQSLRVRCVK